MKVSHHIVASTSPVQKPPHPPYPPPSTHAPPAYQHNAHVYWDDMDVPIGAGPPLAETLPPFHYNSRDPEAGVGRTSQDFSLGGEYWFQDGGDSSSYGSSDSSSPDEQVQ